MFDKRLNPAALCIRHLELMHWRQKPKKMSLYPYQGCQVFLGTTDPNRKKYTPNGQNTWPQIVSYGLKLFQIAIKYTKIFHSKALSNILILAFWVQVHVHDLATLTRT
jgi:hypothetical protein